SPSYSVPTAPAEPRDGGIVPSAHVLFRWSPMRKSSQPALIVGTLALVASFMAQGAASQAPPGGQAPSPAAPAAPNPAAPGQGAGGPQAPQVVSPEVGV